MDERLAEKLGLYVTELNKEKANINSYLNLDKNKRTINNFDKPREIISMRWKNVKHTTHMLCGTRVNYLR